MSALDLENLCGLPTGWFDWDAVEVVSLKTRVDSPSRDPFENGEVNTFPLSAVGSADGALTHRHRADCPPLYI